MEAPNVLIGDDSSFMRIMLTSALGSLGLNVVATAKNSQEAIDKYLELKPQIVLLDLAIADVNDFATIRAIERDNPSAAIILMIPEQMDVADVIVDAVRAGAGGYMRKPISPEELKMRIGSALRRQKDG